jgi:hypothetical protein
VAQGNITEHVRLVRERLVESDERALFEPLVSDIDARSAPPPPRSRVSAWA